VFIVPKRVYYDNRLESGKPRNTVIILAEVRDYEEYTIKACELNGALSKSVEVLKENTKWVRHHRSINDTHYVLLVQCLGLPQDAIINGSIAKLIYRKKGDDYCSRVESEKPLFLHSGSLNPSNPTKGKGSIVMCTTLFDHPERFDQWLKYSRFFGVDKVHLNVHESFAEKAWQDYPFLNESLKTGFAEMEVWKNSRIYWYSEMLKYNDCLYRHIGVFEFGLFLDADDFFNPTVPNERDIHYYFPKLFSNKNIGSVEFQWHQMKCAPVRSKVKETPNGNLTNILTGHEWTLRSARKSANRLSSVLLMAVHNVDNLLQGYHRVRSDGKLAYVAHNRITTTKDCSRHSRAIRLEPISGVFLIFLILILF
jgi:hypothetical protein